MSPERWVASGLRGTEDLVRISASDLADREVQCPSRLAAKVRPRMAADPYIPSSGGYVDFPLDPLMKVLDDVEFGGLNLVEALEALHGREDAHAGLRAWTEHAARAYLTTAAPSSALSTASSTPPRQVEALRPVRAFWVVQHRSGGRWWELYAWGRRYASADGRVRELRLLRIGTPKTARDPALVAVAAYSVAVGVPADRPERWRDRFQPDEPEAVERVRVVEVIATDGSCSPPLFDGTPDEARARFEADARPLLADLVNDGTERPGDGCGTCKRITACLTVPRVPGLLGLATPDAPLRTCSMSELRYHERCGGQAHLMDLHLPRAPYGLPARRGNAVHSWLDVNHRAAPAGRCTVADLPLRQEQWGEGAEELSGDAAVEGHRMLAHHLDVCPFDGDNVARDPRSEQNLAFYDPDANVVIMVKPDLLYLDDGRFVWRETKTTGRLPYVVGTDLIRSYPQLALAIMLLHHRAFGPMPGGSRVELELLSADDSDVPYFDPDSPDDVAAASERLQSMARAWRLDTSARFVVGDHCDHCMVNQWCPAYPTRTTSCTGLPS